MLFFNQNFLLGGCYDMAIKQPSWNKFEAAILLDALIAPIEGKINRMDVIKKVSKDLRAMAINCGIKIDNLYRNENGILFQMYSMESAYYGQTIFKPATRLFLYTVDLYNNSPNEYQVLLKEAKSMIENKKTVEEDFFQYLSEKFSTNQLSGLYLCYSEIEKFCIKLKVLKKPLFQTTDFETIKKVRCLIEQNKIFRLTHKKQFNKILSACKYYYTYIKEKHFNQELQNNSSSIIPISLETHDRTTIVEDDKNITLPITRTEQDERLQKKYPIIYKQIYTALKELSNNNLNGISIAKINEETNHAARPAVIEEILDNVSWALSVGDSYTFSIETVDQSVIITEPECDDKENAKNNIVYEIDFNNDFDLSFTKPLSFSYFGEQKQYKNSWEDLYVAFIATMYEDYPHIFVPGISFLKNSTRIELSENTNYAFMYAPKSIPGTNLMLETNFSANNIAARIKYILEICNVDFENVVITYKKNKSETEIYKFDRTNNDEYKRSIGYGKVKDSKFYCYLKDTLKMADATCHSYASAIKNCEVFAKEHNLDSTELYTDDKATAIKTIKLLINNSDFKEYNLKQHNRFHVALQKYTSFMGIEFPNKMNLDRQIEFKELYRNEPIEVVLKQYFTKGFRMESPLEIRKLKRYYAEINEMELIESDDEISNIIKSLCIIYDGKAFLPETMLSVELKEKLFEYIETAFAEGKIAIYYQAIYTEFSEEFLDYHIYNADMLKAYLAVMGNGKFYINKNFISKEQNVTLDPLSEIRSCLIEYGRPVEYDELFDSLPHLPHDKIKHILASNLEFVNNGQGAYFHEKILKLSEEELEGIAGIINKTIVDKDFISGNELYDAIKAKYSYIVEENKNLSVYGFRDALKAKIGDRFSFKGNIISKFGQELSMADVFAKYAQTHDSFTLSELQGLASNLATVIYFDAVYKNSLRISKEQFVSKDMTQFVISDTDDALERVCTGKYISIKEVENFGIFPYAGFSWNGFLLEHYVASYSQKYKLLHSSFNGSECAGAIVKRSAGIESFDDLIVDILINNQIELEKSTVLQFLCDKGFIARRRYSEIESLIIKAKAQRQRKDEN